MGRLKSFKLFLGQGIFAMSMKMLQIQNGFFQGAQASFRVRRLLSGCACFFQGAQDSLHCYRFYFCL